MFQNNSTWRKKTQSVWGGCTKRRGEAAFVWCMGGQGFGGDSPGWRAVGEWVRGQRDAQPNDLFGIFCFLANNRCCQSLFPWRQFCVTGAYMNSTFRTRLSGNQRMVVCVRWQKQSKLYLDGRYLQRHCLETSSSGPFASENAGFSCPMAALPWLITRAKLSSNPCQTISIANATCRFPIPSIGAQLAYR